MSQTSQVSQSCLVVLERPLPLHTAPRTKHQESLSLRNQARVCYISDTVCLTPPLSPHHWGRTLEVLEAEELLTFAKALREDVVTRLQKRYPTLGLAVEDPPV